MKTRDIAHIGLLHRQITFSVVDVLKKYNIPVVMHLHELTAVCPCYTMLRQDGLYAVIVQQKDIGIV